MRYFWDDFGGFIIATVAGMFVFAVCIGGIVGATYYSDRAECNYVRENAGATTKFVRNHLFSWDCYVTVDGKWIPISKWRGDEE